MLFRSEDARSAYLWMLEQDIPAAEIIVSGDSSGGGLVMSLLLLLRDQGMPLPGGAVLLCPGLDLAAFLDGTSASATDENFEKMSRILSWYVLDHPLDDPLISSLAAELSGLPPLLIQAATGDSFGPEARLLAQRAEEYGVQVVAELYPVDTHNFQLFWSFLPEAQEALTKVGDFVARTRQATEQRRGQMTQDT